MSVGRDNAARAARTPGDATPPIVLVTGTDTGVGKTLVTASLAAALAGRGRRVGVVKPVETGCRTEDGALYPEDAATLAAAAGSTMPLEMVCPLRFPDPLAPALAAERVGARIDLAALVEGVRALARAHDLVLVEGAGGLLVPLTTQASYADLATALGAAVVLVVGSRLGAINHALLTLDVLAARGLVVRGFVMSPLSAVSDLATETNTDLLRRLTRVPYLGELPWIADADELTRALRRGGADREDARARLAALAAAHLDLERLGARGDA